MNNKKIKEILEWTVCILIAIIIALLIRYYVGTPTVVQQSSMFPTLQQNDRLLLSHLVRTFNEMPKRGEIITFEAPSNAKTGAKSEKAEYSEEPSTIFQKFMYNVLEIGKQNYIKRVVALPGEHVEIKEEVIYINGEKLKENYLQESVITEAKSTYLKDFIVPEGYIFALGDNRKGSVDCRYFGCIPMSKVEGTVILRFWPLDKFGKVI